MARRTKASLSRDVQALQGEVAELRTALAEMAAVLQRLDDDVRAGSADTLPLYLGYAERLRVDTETSVSAAKVIEQQIAELKDLVARLPKA
jgi:prefoldin subunit 5